MTLALHPVVSSALWGWPVSSRHPFARVCPALPRFLQRPEWTAPRSVASWAPRVRRDCLASFDLAYHSCQPSCLDSRVWSALHSVASTVRQARRARGYSAMYPTVRRLFEQMRRLITARRRQWRGKIA